MENSLVLIVILPEVYAGANNTKQSIAGTNFGKKEIRNKKLK